MDIARRTLPLSVHNQLAEIARSRAKAITLSENSWFTDAVGTFTAGASYLLGGAPGSRKSGMAMQIALDLARQGHRVLLIPTEEPYDRVFERLIRMMGDDDPKAIMQSLENFEIERNPPPVELLPNYISSQILSPSGVYHGTSFLVLDSVQGHGLAGAATRAYERVLESTRLLSGAGITSLLINHLTKRHELAGPRTLEHGVDAVLILRKTPSCRLLFTIKNRHGPANMREPVALVLDPVSLCLLPTPLTNAIHASAKTYLGSGLGGPIEVQASVGLAACGARGRVTAPGLPKAELQQLLATIGQLPGVEIDDLDFTIHCRLPGNRRFYGCHAQLALAMSLLSSYLRKSIPTDALFLGEIDLGRKIRPIDEQLTHDLITALETGDELMGSWTIYCHPQTARMLPKEGLKLVGCEQLDTVLYSVWPDLR